MEAIVFIGAQGSGKSTFYKDKFFNTHMRISLDLLNTRNKENIFIESCIKIHQKFVIDNTNPSIDDRKKYFDKLKDTKYQIIAYYFESDIKSCLERNSKRTGKEKIPEIGILSTYKKIQVPSYDEGFNEIYYVSINANNDFEIKEIKNEI